MAENFKYYYTPLSNFLHQHNGKFEHFGLLINILMCFLCLAIWMVPTAFSADTIISTRALLAFEFIILHSAIFMMAGKWLMVPLYFLFAYSFNQQAPDNAIMITYLVIVLNRVRFMFMENGSDLEGMNAGRAIYQFFFNYFPLILICILLERIGLMPRFGMSEETLKNMEATDHGDVSHATMMAFGFFYYLRGIYLDKKLSQHFEKRKITKDTFQEVLIIGTDIVGKKVAGKFSNFLNSTILISNHPEAIKNDNKRDDLLDMTPIKWLEKHEQLQLKRPEEISEKPKMIINTLPIEEAVFLLNTFEKKLLEDVIILDLSGIEFLSNRLEIEKPSNQSLSNYFPKNAIVELTTNVSCVGLVSPAYFNKGKFVNLKGREQYAIDKVRILLHGLGWKNQQINQMILNMKSEV